MARTRGSGRGTRRISTTEELEDEYAYVIRDLRQILILAVIMFALLIGLNLIMYYSAPRGGVDGRVSLCYYSNRADVMSGAFVVPQTVLCLSG